MENQHSGSERGITEKSLQSHGIAWFILAIALAFTAFVTYNTRKAVEKEAIKEFTFECNEIIAKMYAGLNSHAQLLRTGAAFFEASDSVSRSEWNIFISHQKIETNLPGVQGVGYAMIIPGNALREHEQHIRSEGLAGYTVKPAGNRETYTSIVYLEPFSGKNLQAIGYDMYSEPIRRAAMKHACDSNIAALSGKVKLVQDANAGDLAGALLYVPIYRRGMEVATVADRRMAIKGWVYSPYRMNDLVRGILGDFESGQKKLLRLQIYDNNSITANALLFDSNAENENNSDHFKKLKLKLPVIFNGKHWTLFFTQTTQLSSFYFQKRVLQVFSAGTAISILIFLLAIFLLNSRNREKLTAHLARHLEQNLDKHMALYNAIPDAVLVTDSKTGRIEEFNNKASQQYGYTYSEFSCLKSSDLSTKQESAEYPGPGTEMYLTDRYHKRKDGSFFPVEISGSTFELDNSIKTISVARDITERQKIDEALHTSEALYKSIFLASPDNITITDLNGLIIMVSPAALPIFGLKNNSQILGHNIKEFLAPHERERATSVMETMLVSSERRPLNFKCLQYDGNIIETEINGEIILDADLKPHGFVFILRDITERIQGEELLRATVKEKEILLREVHHRVKNNLQVVSSLLNLQAKKISDNAFKEMLEQSRNRIRSIALVHEKLYQTGNFAEINLKEYTRSLVAELFRMVLADPAKITIRTEIEDINIPLIYAIPCGLIMNEIISNSLKYAFPENYILEKQPEIFISLRTLPNHYLQLSAGDNGIGLPADYQSTDSSSLGLYLIHILATEQLDGEISINTEKGTIFTITFNPFPK